jgi:hypothetical protein
VKHICDGDGGLKPVPRSFCLYIEVTAKYEESDQMVHEANISRTVKCVSVGFGFSTLTTILQHLGNGNLYVM